MKDKKRIIVNKGELIQKAREAAGLTKSDLARKVGVSKTTVDRWEHNDTNITYENLIALKKIIKLPDYFFKTQKDFKMIDPDVVINYLLENKRKNMDGRESVDWLREIIFDVVDCIFVED